jgi:hypothetical protein
MVDFYRAWATCEDTKVAKVLAIFKEKEHGSLFLKTLYPNAKLGQVFLDVTENPNLVQIQTIGE